MPRQNGSCVSRGNGRPNRGSLLHLDVAPLDAPLRQRHGDLLGSKFGNGAFEFRPTAVRNSISAPLYVSPNW